MWVTMDRDAGAPHQRGIGSTTNSANSEACGTRTDLTHAVLKWLLDRLQRVAWASTCGNVTVGFVPMAPIIPYHEVAGSSPVAPTIASKQAYYATGSISATGLTPRIMRSCFETLLSS